VLLLCLLAELISDLFTFTQCKPKPLRLCHAVPSKSYTHLLLYLPHILLTYIRKALSSYQQSQLLPSSDIKLVRNTRTFQRNNTPVFTMSTEIRIESNILSNIPSNVTDFCITSMRAEAYTLGPLVDDDGDWTKSKNHWALVFQGPNGAIRLSMETRQNAITGVMGSLVLKTLSYVGTSYQSVHHEAYTWQDASATLGDVLGVIISTRLHRFEMIPNRDGSFKGCRHWGCKFNSSFTGVKRN
jgi:hypothetical protein